MLKHKQPCRALALFLAFMLAALAGCGSSGNPPAERPPVETIPLYLKEADMLSIGEAVTFASIDEALAFYAGCLRNANTGAIARAFWPNPASELRSGAELSLPAWYVDAFLPGSYLNSMAAVMGQIQEQYVGLLTHRNSLGTEYFTKQSEYTATEVAAMLKPSALGALELLQVNRVEHIPLRDGNYYDRYILEDLSHAAVAEHYLLLFDLDGELFAGGIQLVDYLGTWRIGTLFGVGKALPYGLAPITLDAYDQLVRSAGGNPGGVRPASQITLPKPPQRNPEFSLYFKTPELAVSYFIDCMKEKNVQAALRAFSAPAKAQRCNFEQMAAASGYLEFATATLPSTHAAYIPLNEARFWADAADGLNYFLSSLMMAVNDPADIITQKVTGGDKDAVYELIDTAALSGVRLLRADIVPASLSLPKQIKDIYASDGFEETLECIALLELRSSSYICGFTLGRFEEGWQIDELTSRTADMTAYGGAYPATEAEYLSLLNEAF